MEVAIVIVLVLCALIWRSQRSSRTTEMSEQDLVRMYGKGKNNRQDG